MVGVGWLVFVQVRRHKRVREDLEFLHEQYGGLLKMENQLRKATELAEQLEGADRGGALSQGTRRRLVHISLQLLLLQSTNTIQLARQHDADQEAAKLLAEWRLRSPITRSDE